MTINEFIESLPELKNDNGTNIKEALLNTICIWSNDACRGYCLKAMQNAGFDDTQIAKVLNNLFYSFDEITIGEAEKIYLEYPNK